MNYIKTFFARIFEFICACISTDLWIWYLFWFTAFGIYLYCNWADALVFSPFNGNALILIVWIIMILMPFVHTAGVSGSSVKFRQLKDKQEKAKKELDKKLQAAEQQSKQPVEAAQGQQEKDGGDNA